VPSTGDLTQDQNQGPGQDTWPGSQQTHFRQGVWIHAGKPSVLLMPASKKISLCLQENRSRAASRLYGITIQIQIHRKAQPENPWQGNTKKNTLMSVQASIPPPLHALPTPADPSVRRQGTRNESPPFSISACQRFSFFSLPLQGSTSPVKNNAVELVPFGGEQAVVQGRR